MPQLRQNIATKEWVIIATERAKRPEDFYCQDKTSVEPLPAFSPHCPFCPGNESQTPPELYSLRKDSQWEIRVTPNKFPALVSKGKKIHHLDDGKHWMNGVGIHEVIVETPIHNQTTALLPEPHITDILRTYRERFFAALNDEKIEMVTIFKNHGESAGTSLAHPHSQLIATPIVPLHVRHRVSEAMNYFDEHGECVFCRMIQDERKDGERMVFETEHFVAFVLYAARSPFHTWILPKRHFASFPEIAEDELADLSILLKIVLSRLYYGLGNPDYNYVIHSLPGHVRRNEFFHWRLAVIPRLTKTAGFEMGSGIHINTSLPEESARFLRDVKLPHREPVHV
jgi:UDPglucose--hexose-1-phosphate uridylyltransferase